MEGKLNIIDMSSIFNIFYYPQDMEGDTALHYAAFG